MASLTQKRTQLESEIDSNIVLLEKASGLDEYVSIRNKVTILTLKLDYINNQIITGRQTWHRQTDHINAL